MKSLLSFSLKATYVFGLVLVTLFVAKVMYVNSQRELQSEVNNQRTFSVNGEATKDVTLDTAKLNLGITLRGDSAQKLQQEATQKYNEAIGKIKAAGIPEEDIKTQGYNVNPVYDPEKGTPNGYEVALSLEVTVRNTNPESELVSKIVNAGNEAGFNTVNSLQFYLEDIKAVQDQIKELAIQDAKSRAEKEASQAGLKLGKVLNVYENNYGPFNSYAEPMMAGAEFKAVDTEESLPPIEIQPGQTEVKVQVTIEYETL